MSNDTFSREFRRYLQAQLRTMPGWTEWRQANCGANGTPSKKQEFVAAAAALGLEIDVARARFEAMSAETLAIATKDEGMPVMDEDEDEDSAPAAAPAAAQGFEGRDADELLAELLAPAGLHLTPFLQQELPKLIRPAIQAAVQGPRTVTVIKRAPAAGAASVIPHANVVSWQKPNVVFGLSPSRCGKSQGVLVNGKTIAVCDYAAAPKVDPDYYWQPEILAALVAADASGENGWCHGPAGTGKTEAAAQYAARTRRPFFRIAIDRSTEPADIIGQEVLGKAGGMEWRDGKLTAAFRQPYAVILIDEPTLLRSGALAIFQTALDGARRLFLPTGEIVEAETGVLVLAADNTSGTGDDTGRYLDTSPVNAALLDRFGLLVEFSHLSPATEANMLAHRTGIPVAAARFMADFAALTRRDVAAGKLTMGITPRRLIAWSRAVMVGMTSETAFNHAITQGVAPEDKEALLMLVNTSLASQHATIDALAHGKAVAPAAGAAAAPAGPSKAGSVFEDDQG